MYRVSPICIISYNHISYGTWIVMLQRKYKFCMYSICLYCTLNFCHGQNFYWYFTVKVWVDAIPAGLDQFIVWLKRAKFKLKKSYVASLYRSLSHWWFFFFLFFQSYYLSIKQAELDLEWTILDSNRVRTGSYSGFAWL